MPLHGSESALASELKNAMKNVKDYNEAWEKMAAIILSHITKNALVIGACPSGGGPLSGGKLQ
jgi:hypothetical protein